MGKFFQVNPENKIPVIICFIGVFVTFWVSTIPSMQIAGLLYFALALIGLFVYTNPTLQRVLIGIPKKGFITSSLIGLVAGFAILMIPKFGLSIGVPILPASVEQDLRWVVICIFAPFFEEIATRGALLGLIKYIGSKGRTPSTTVVWVAIFLQAAFFTIIHFTAYSQGWYTAPNFGGAIDQVAAVSASLISAFIFGLVMGILVTRKGINSLATSIMAHYLVNQIIFVQLYAIFV